jgi:hypothetical protein
MHRTITSIEILIEQLWDDLEDDPSLGDDGVAEVLAEIENLVGILTTRLDKREKTS